MIGGFAYVLLHAPSRRYEEGLIVDGNRQTFSTSLFARMFHHSLFFEFCQQIVRSGKTFFRKGETYFDPSVDKSVRLDFDNFTKKLKFGLF